ncbi:beta-ketoacyl-[acyl-carrier-protein] synthase family protein [Actinoallomurus acaciae]|uniref:Beta-ketoacyl-[acyl-carrier-protein] synthase family protein n=1 Tax=Actinoallomurus acaciae TaxID=502577 RepID=A0ABV5YIH4_9ACTN
MNRAETAVTGLGLVTPAGIGVPATWAGLCAGRSTAGRDERLAGLPVDLSCRVPGFDPAARLGRRLIWRIDRFTQLALVAAREAVADAGLDPAGWDGTRVAVVIGCGGGGDHLTEEYEKFRAGRIRAMSPLAIPRTAANMVAGEIGMDLQALGPNLVTSTACASGTTAIGVARDLLRGGACDVAIAGGTECACVPLVTAMFAQMRVLSDRRDDPATAIRPFASDRNGFVLAEGAGILVLERAADAAARGADVHAYLAGYGATADGYHQTAPDPSAQGVTRAMREALRDADIDPRDVHHVNAHATATPHNDLAEARALHAVFPSPPPVTATKSIIGHSIGGAGAIEAACTVLTLRHRTIPPTANLDRLDPAIDLDVVTGSPRRRPMAAAMSNSFAFGGQNAVLVFRAA